MRKKYRNALNKMDAKAKMAIADLLHVREHLLHPTFPDGTFNELANRFALVRLTYAIVAFSNIRTLKEVKGDSK